MISIQLSKFYLLSLLVLVGCSSCTSITQAPTIKKPLALEFIDKIQIKKTSPIQIESEFGVPTLILPIKGTELQSWSYCSKVQCTQGRMTIHLNPKSQEIRRVIWNTEIGDPERDLQVVLQRYPDAHFIKRRIVADYGGYIDYRTSYAEEKSGIEIGYDEQRKFVTSISRHEPGEASGEFQTVKRDGLPRITVLREPETALNSR